MCDRQIIAVWASVRATQSLCLTLPLSVPGMGWETPAVSEPVD